MKLKHEIPVWTLIAIPFIYILFLWNGLPEQVPLHWNIDGEIDRWGSRATIWLIPFLLPFLIYAIFFLVKKYDPKGRMAKMGGKFYSLRFSMVLIFSAFAVFILYSVSEGTTSLPHTVFVLIGLLFATLGNFFKTIQPNYFIGIRTPWTLENEAIWKSTHKLAGILWFFGGIVLIIIALFFRIQIALYVMLTITIIISVWPLLYSFLAAKKLKQ